MSSSTISLFDYDGLDLRAEAEADADTSSGSDPRKRLEKARYRLLVAQSAHRNAIARAESDWLRGLPPVVGRRGIALIEAVHADLVEAREASRRPWHLPARRRAEVLALEEKLTLEHYGFRSYEQFAAREAGEEKPVLAEPASVRRARKVVEAAQDAYRQANESVGLTRSA